MTSLVHFVALAPREIADGERQVPGRAASYVLCSRCGAGVALTPPTAQPLSDRPVPTPRAALDIDVFDISKQVAAAKRAKRA